MSTSNGQPRDDQSQDRAQPGIRCPHCNCAEHRVETTRQKGRFIVRYRVCRYCARRFPTVERATKVLDLDDFSPVPDDSA